MGSGRLHGFALFALARQIGILYERVAPMGALMMDDGPSVGEQSPHFNLETLDNRRIDIGNPQSKVNSYFSSPKLPSLQEAHPCFAFNSKSGRTLAQGHPSQ